jgi:uncharacterized protein (UPF0335 family)
MNEQGTGAREAPGANQVRDYIERYKNLMEQQKATSEDIRELGTEAKGNGFDPVALKALARREIEDPEKARRRMEREAIIETYASAIGVEW